MRRHGPLLIAALSSIGCGAAPAPVVTAHPSVAPVIAAHPSAPAALVAQWGTYDPEHIELIGDHALLVVGRPSAFLVDLDGRTRASLELTSWDGAIQISPDALTAYVGGRAWSLETGASRQVWPPNRVVTALLGPTAFGGATPIPSAGRMVVARQETHTAMLLDADGAVLVADVTPGHDVIQVAIDPMGATFAVLARDGVFVCDARDGASIAMVPPATDEQADDDLEVAAWEAAYSPDGAILYLQTGTIVRAVETRTGRTIAEHDLEREGFGFFTVALAPGGAWLLAEEQESRLVALRAADLSPFAMVELDHDADDGADESLWRSGIRPLGSIGSVLASSEDGRHVVLDLAQPDAARPLDVRGRFAALGADGRRAAFLDRDAGTITIADLASGAIVATVPVQAPTLGLRDVSVLSDRVALAAGADTFIAAGELVRLRGCEEGHAIEIAPGRASISANLRVCTEAGEVRQLEGLVSARSEDGTMLLVPHEGGLAAMDAVTGEVRALTLTGDRFSGVAALSRDGSRAVAATVLGLSLFDTRSGASLRATRERSAIRALVFVLDGSRLVAAAEDGSVTLRDTETLAVISRLEGSEAARAILGSMSQVRRFGGREFVLPVPLDAVAMPDRDGVVFFGGVGVRVVRIEDGVLREGATLESPEGGSISESGRYVRIQMPGTRTEIRRTSDGEVVAGGGDGFADARLADVAARCDEGQLVVGPSDGPVRALGPCASISAVSDDGRFVVLRERADVTRIVRARDGAGVRVSVLASSDSARTLVAVFDDRQVEVLGEAGAWVLRRAEGPLLDAALEPFAPSAGALRSFLTATD